jgi:hypothetical protein
MQLRLFVTAISFALALVATPAFAQYGARALSEPATGETYHFEVGGGFYSPTPTLFISSEGLGIPGDEIDFVKEFDLENQTFK